MQVSLGNEKSFGKWVKGLKEKKQKQIKIVKIKSKKVWLQVNLSMLFKPGL